MVELTVIEAVNSTIRSFCAVFGALRARTTAPEPEQRPRTIPSATGRTTAAALIAIRSPTPARTRPAGDPRPQRR